MVIAKKKVVQPMSSTQCMWIGLVRLDLCDGWLDFFLTHNGGLG